jgi:hypothetical protein
MPTAQKMFIKDGVGPKLGMVTSMIAQIRNRGDLGSRHPSTVALDRPKG